MGGFTNIAQSLGSVGGDVLTAQQGLKQIDQQGIQNRLANITAQLRIRQLQQSLGTQADPFQQKIASYERVLGRPLTDVEKQTLMGLQPAATQLPKTPFEVWRAQNPNSPAADWLNLQESVKPHPAVTDKTAFELWRTQNPNASVADWLKLQERYRKS